MENETKKKFVYLLENSKMLFSFGILKILTESCSIEKFDYVNKSRHAFDLTGHHRTTKRTSIHI